MYQGGKNGHKKYHKKGSKTTGFHHKGHKDDFHKEHKFYDSEEKKGDHKKYGSEHEYHESKKGEHKKGEKHDSGFDEGHKGKQFTSDDFKWTFNDNSEIDFWLIAWSIWTASSNW